jgi:hypothetical protein
MTQGMQERELFLCQQRQKIYELQKSLERTEMALVKKHEDHHHLLEENKRLDLSIFSYAARWPLIIVMRGSCTIDRLYTQSHHHILWFQRTQVRGG